MTLSDMRILFLFTLLFFTPLTVNADNASADKEEKAETKLPPVDLDHGMELYKKCALCHGQYAQGTQSGFFPRLAGMPIHYLVSQMKKYQDGSRSNAYSVPMLVVGGMKDMDAKDLNDIASYMASIDLSKHMDFTLLPTPNADIKKGKKLFKDDCKSCHAKNASGKEKKKTPPLSGQHSLYLERETKFFMAKDRHHDNDPEDETFEDYSEQELRDIFSYIATIPFIPEKGYFTAPDAPKAPAKPKAPAAPVKIAIESSGNTESVKIETVTQTVLKMALKKGLSVEDSVEAMLSKALEKNMKNVGRQQVSKELKARGIDSPYLDIFQFCNPEDAIKMVKFNTIFAAYMPCRIALVEDAKGKMWLEMLNLDMLINSANLPAELEGIAIETNGTMLDILTAGATGDF
ncbi:MAG: c-type cytochrome [Cocleimonas sp.]|nr:c-type cytochrome [Cocleimonas sp.]